MIGQGVCAQFVCWSTLYSRSIVPVIALLVHPLVYFEDLQYQRTHVASWGAVSSGVRQHQANAERGCLCVMTTTVALDRMSVHSCSQQLWW